MINNIPISLKKPNGSLKRYQAAIAFTIKPIEIMGSKLIAALPP